MSFPQRTTPSYTRYAKINQNVIGINVEEVNRDRRQMGFAPLPYKTKFKK